MDILSRLQSYLADTPSEEVRKAWEATKQAENDSKMQVTITVTKSFVISGLPEMNDNELNEFVENISESVNIDESLLNNALLCESETIEVLHSTAKEE
jgi:hypothetical protein